VLNLVELWARNVEPFAGPPREVDRREPVEPLPDWPVESPVVVRTSRARRKAWAVVASWFGLAVGTR
jgi:hypothetical protein